MIFRCSCATIVKHFNDCYDICVLVICLQNNAFLSKEIANSKCMQSLYNCVRIQVIYSILTFQTYCCSEAFVCSTKLISNSPNYIPSSFKYFLSHAIYMYWQSLCCFHCKQEMYNICWAQLL